jgi:small ligand-binding sensory domain FIST
MGIEAGIAVSTKADLVEAAVEAAKEARGSCDQPKLVLMFVNHSYPLEHLGDALREARRQFPGGTRLTGGTVNGITYGDARHDAMFNNKRAVAVVVLGGDVDVGVAMVPDPSEDPFEAGKALALAARTGLGPSTAKGGIVLTPGMSGFHVIDQLILDGIRSTNPRLRMTGTGLTAGLMPDGQIIPGLAFLDDQIERRGTVLVTFGGPTSLGFSSANGMEPVGTGGFVTDADGPIIKTIDRRPARDAILDLICGDDAEARAQFTKSPFIAAVERGVTLGAVDPEGTHYWCHMPVAFLPDGSAVDPFIARRGTPLSVVRIDSNTCMSAVKEAGSMLVDDAGTDDFELTLAFSCALRGYTLGAEVAHEDMQLGGLIKSRKHLGIVANGEVSCYRHGRPFATGWVYALFGMAEQGR